MGVMSNVLRILVLGNALLLALPPGWCCLLPARPTAPAPEDALPCCPLCRHEAQQPASPPEACPNPPAGGCSCQSDPATPPQAKTAAPDLSVAPDFASAGEALAPTGIGPALAVLPSFASPPLQVLLCVWRC
jgi:hypothetical protein